MNEHQTLLQKMGQPLGVDLLNKALRAVKPNQYEDLMFVLLAALSSIFAALDRGAGPAFTDALLRAVNEGITRVRKDEADQAGRPH